MATLNDGTTLLDEIMRLQAIVPKLTSEEIFTAVQDWQKVTQFQIIMIFQRK